MYLLFLDESGTHGGSPVFVLAGIAVHETATQDLQRWLEEALERLLPSEAQPERFEIHRSEIQSPKSDRSPWRAIPYPARMWALEGVTRAVVEFAPRNGEREVVLFGAVVDRRYRDHERRAYEEVLHRFQSMLIRTSERDKSTAPDMGLVIHDHRIAERSIQARTQQWRTASSRIGRLTRLADVPLFADSRASRLIQTADLIAYGLWRYYGPEVSDARLARLLWPRFDASDGVMHGMVHVWEGYRQDADCCPPCRSRR